MITCDTWDFSECWIFVNRRHLFSYFLCQILPRCVYGLRSMFARVTFLAKNLVLHVPKCLKSYYCKIGITFVLGSLFRWNLGFCIASLSHQISRAASYRSSLCPDQTDSFVILSGTGGSIKILSYLLAGKVGWFLCLNYWWFLSLNK